MRKAIEIKQDMEAVKYAFGDNEVKKRATVKMKNEIIACKDLEALSKYLMKIVDKDIAFFDANLKSLDEKIIELTEELEKSQEAELVANKVTGPKLVK